MVRMEKACVHVGSEGANCVSKIRVRTHIKEDRKRVSLTIWESQMFYENQGDKILSIYISLGSTQQAIALGVGRDKTYLNGDTYL